MTHESLMRLIMQLIMRGGAFGRQAKQSGAGRCREEPRLILQFGMMHKLSMVCSA